MTEVVVGVLALQGAFEEHQKCLEAIGCQTVQVRTPNDLSGIDGIVLPGGESTAMGLIGTVPLSSGGNQSDSTATTKNSMNMWDSLRAFGQSGKPIWGTCAGMILLAERCVGTSPVIQGGQALIGGMDITVVRNYFGSQISSFEMPVEPPPTIQQLSCSGSDTTATSNGDSIKKSYPGVFIRAPAILSAGPSVQVLGTVVATPCRQAAVTLQELERKIAAGENVVQINVADALERGSGGDDMGSLRYKVVVTEAEDSVTAVSHNNDGEQNGGGVIILPGAADTTNARKVISATRKGHLLCTAFHPELTDDYRWHEYFLSMVKEVKFSP